MTCLVKMSRFRSSFGSDGKIARFHSSIEHAFYYKHSTRTFVHLFTRQLHTVAARPARKVLKGCFRSFPIITHGNVDFCMSMVISASKKLLVIFGELQKILLDYDRC